jgi:hypothetical protein
MSSPQRRLTSVFDLEKSRWESRLQLIVSGYKPGLLLLKHHVSLRKQGIDHKTLLAVTNAAVEPAIILTSFDRFNEF